MSCLELNSYEFCTNINPNFANASVLGQLTMANGNRADTAYAIVVDGNDNLQFYCQTTGSDIFNPITISSVGEVTIPSLSVPGGDVLSISSGFGSGMNCIGTTNVNLTSALVAGENITLTSSSDTTALTISATGSTGVSSITAPIGSGVTIDSTNPLIPAVSSNLIAGTNVTLTPSVSDNSITISASGGGGGGGVNSVANGGLGSGITIGGTVDDPTVSANLVAGSHITLTPSVVDSSLSIAYDLKVPTVFVQYLAPPLPGGAIQLGYQTILGTANQYFTLTAGLWQISLSGLITFNSSTSSPALNFTLQQQTTNTVISAWNLQCHNAFYTVNYNMPSQIYTVSNLVLGLFIQVPSGSPLAQSISNINVNCIYLGGAQDPLSSGTPYY